MNNNPTLTDVAETLLALRWADLDEFAGVIAALNSSDRHRIAARLVAWAGSENTGEDAA